MGYWTVDKGKNRRAYFEGYARKLNKDPLLVETWYSVSRSDILEEKVRP